MGPKKDICPHDVNIQEIHLRSTVFESRNSFEIFAEPHLSHFTTTADATPSNVGQNESFYGIIRHVRFTHTHAHRQVERPSLNNSPSDRLSNSASTDGHRRMNPAIRLFS